MAIWNPYTQGYSQEELESELKEYRKAIRARNLKGFNTTLNQSAASVSRQAEELRKLEAAEKQIISALHSLDSINYPIDPLMSSVSVPDFSSLQP